MKNYKSDLTGSMALILSLGMYQPAAAEQVTTINIPAMCVDIKSLTELVDEFAEIPAMVMTSKRDINGTAISNNVVLFVNFKEKSYTMVERVAKDIYCILAVGDDIQPYQKK
jgi:hypothetical protein